MSIDKKKLKAVVVLVASPLAAAATGVPTVFDGYPLSQPSDYEVVFDPTGTGEQLPVDWGLDTAWNDDVNMIRGIRYITPECLSIARVSFNPYELITTPGVLPNELQNRLDKRLDNVARIGHKVDIALNLDAAEPYRMGDYYHIAKNDKGELYVDWDRPDGGTYNHAEWAKLIDATAAAVEAKGYTVVSAAPFNEPDYQYNGLTKANFMAINKELKNYPRFNTIRISGGNTLNCDEADPWYEYLKEDLDEGNTHQLAGDFNHYASFFEKVRNEGKHATADELHNVMEAMVGVEYGMQTGIWWGTAERVRGEFCQASNKGERLAYAENRGAWSAASVYRSPGKLQAFVGCSERQARPSNYKFVSTGDRALYADGVGPVIDVKVDVPADPNGGYMTIQQRTAEGVVDFTWGEDVQPEIDGTYIIVNKKSGRAVTFDGNINGGNLNIGNYSTTEDNMKWNVKRVSHDDGGDFSYWCIDWASDEKASWNLKNFEVNMEYDPNNKYFVADIIVWPNNKANTADPHNYDSNMQWFLQYDGDGWFHIRSKHSNYCLRTLKGATVKGTKLTQAPYDAEDESQKFRFVAVENAPAQFETTAPAAPADLAASATPGSVSLTWTASTDADVVSYALLRDNGDGQFNTVARGITGTSIIDNSVRPGVNYTYKVVAYDACGNRSEASATAQALPSGGAGLWCWYKFDDNMEDAAGNSFHARGGLERYYDGHNGKALRINSHDSAIQLPPSAVPAQQVFTVATWIKGTSTGTTPGSYVFDFGSDESHRVGLRMVNDASNMAMVACNGGEEKTLTAPKLSAGDWHHVAAVFGLNCWTLYVDGEKVAEAAEPGIHANVPAQAMVLNFIGRGQRTYTHPRATDCYTSAISPMKGNVDDFKVYNYALSAEEVKQDMAGTHSGIEAAGIAAGADVESVEYFNLKGIRIEHPVQGEPVVVRTHYTDGTVKTTKEVARP